MNKREKDSERAARNKKSGKSCKKNKIQKNKNKKTKKKEENSQPAHLMEKTVGTTGVLLTFCSHTKKGSLSVEFGCRPGVYQN